VLHSSEFYLAAPPPQVAGLPIDRNTSYLFDIVFHFIHSFRMPLFFMLAGFFAALLVEKRGLAGTYRDRAARVLAPLVAGVLTIVPVTLLGMLGLMIALRFGVMQLLPERAQLDTLKVELQAIGAPVDKITILHLWFLLYLCYFYLTLPACMWLVRRSAPASARIARFLASPWAFMALGLYTAATLWPYRGAIVLEGFLYLTPHVPSLVYYGSFFVLGYFFHAHREILKTFTRHAARCTVLAAVLFPLSMALSHWDLQAGGTSPAYHLAAVVLNGFCTWALIYAIAGWTLRLFDVASPWILYASQSAYWVYLVHIVFVVLFAWLLVPFDLPAFVKFALVAIATTIVCFTTYHYFVRRTWLGAFLHGKRFDLDWPWRAPRAAATVAVS
jgi:glucans biosynthesis protein C